MLLRWQMRSCGDLSEELRDGSAARKRNWRCIRIADGGERYRGWDRDGGRMVVVLKFDDGEDDERDGAC